MKVILHADDFGYNKEVSGDIIDCLKNGRLDSLSIMPNSPFFQECMKMLEGLPVEKTIHFSISEGPSVAHSRELPLLTNDNGMFKLSFFKLLITSFFKKSELKVELKRELKAQLDLALPYLDEINIDSHVHYHMIPLVMESLLEVVEESGRKIGYLRIPAEPISPFLKHLSLYKTYDLVNIVKNLVLNMLALCDRKILKKYEYKTAVFFGIIMSGHMDIDRVALLINDFKNIANKRNMDLEILAHPGRAISDETVLDPYNDEYKKAPLSENRHIEKNMFMEISKYL